MNFSRELKERQGGWSLTSQAVNTAQREGPSAMTLKTPAEGYRRDNKRVESVCVVLCEREDVWVQSSQRLSEHFHHAMLCSNGGVVHMPLIHELSEMCQENYTLLNIFYIQSIQTCTHTQRHIQLDITIRKQSVWFNDYVYVCSDENRTLSPFSTAFFVMDIQR